MATIKLINIGRGKVNKTIEVQNFDEEEDLANIALAEVKHHLMSSEVWLDPDEKKGEGFWTVHVGMGYHVGDVEIKM